MANGNGNWFARLAIGGMFTAMLLLGGILWEVQTSADESLKREVDKKVSKDKYEADQKHIVDILERIEKSVDKIEKKVEARRGQ